MNRLDWAQIALSLGVMLIGFYIALFRHPGRGVLATTRVGGFGVAQLGLSYFAGGFEGSAVEGPLLDRVEAYVVRNPPKMAILQVLVNLLCPPSIGQYR
jgi:hypothetical protein